MIITFVVAMSKNRVIGVKNRLPWVLPTDLQHFQEKTKGHPVIMGSKTYDSIPENRRPLPGRTNIVLTRDRGKTYPGCLMAHTLGEAITLAAQQPGSEEVCIIGGAHVFTEALPLANRIYLTEVDAIIEDGDAFFPELDPVRWQVKEEGSFTKDEKNEYGGKFLVYERTGKFPIVEPGNGRNEEYKAQLERILASGQCPFCPNGETLKEQEIIYENDTWFVKHNAFPLENTVFHFVLTPKRHIEFFDDISDAEWIGLKACRQWLKEKYNFTGDALYARSGELLVTGATVAHFHCHIIVPAGLVQVSFGSYHLK
nr:Dihydrofolate reductase [uncultured bacterium]